MSFFSKVFKGKDSAASSTKSKPGREPGATRTAPKPTWEDAWTRKGVEPEEVAELLHVCSHEMKSRALDTPFLLLPFRPNADPSAARNFIRSFFKNGPGEPVAFKGESLRNEMRLVEPMVLCSIMKWSWSRLKGGVVGWEAYELFKTGENESNMAKHAFDKFIPLSVDSPHKKDIVFDFFDLLSAIAANGKTNGLGGRKLSRLSGWWAFDHSEGATGFDGGYSLWENAAHATSHLFFAYLRARMPDNTAGSSGISQLPRSLLALVSQTEYPPETPTLLLTSTPKVVMVVERVSPTPYALLRRARHFAYPDNDQALQKYADYEDPVRALTFECRRVLDCISSTNQSVTVNHETSITSPGDTSWSRFEDLGFSSVLDGARLAENDTRGYNSADNVRSHANGFSDFGRPTTPSWADFTSAGFADDASSRGPASLLLPPEQILPPLNPQRVQSSQSHVRHGLQDDSLEPGELNYMKRIELDETFWWVWMTSLAGEETPARKAVFGRCALVETELKGAKWLVMEEQVRGAAVAPDTNATVIQKRGRFGMSIRGRPRRSSLGKKPPIPKTKTALAASASTPALNRNRHGAEQKAKVQAAAAELVREQHEEEQAEQVATRRGRLEPTADSKTNSVMTLGLGSSLQSEAGPAMQWARKFDKETIRSRYLGDNLAGTGVSRAPSPAGTMDLISATKAVPDTEASGAASTTVGGLPAAESAPTTLGMSAPTTAQSAIQTTTSPVSPTHAHKESDKTMVSPDDMHHTQRKPVGSIDNTNHPAVREETKPTAAPAQNKSPAAAAAAAAAMRSTQPATTQNGAAAKPEQSAMANKAKSGGTRKFKSLFNRKKPDESEEPEALAKHREMSARKKQEMAARQSSSTPDPVMAAVPDKTVAPVAEAPVVPAAAPVNPTAEEMEAGEPGPAVESHEEHSMAAAMHEPVLSKSEFTEGPLDDQPAFVEGDAPAKVVSAAPVDEPAAPVVHDGPYSPSHVDQKVLAATPKPPVEEPEMADDEFSASSMAPSTAPPPPPAVPQESGDRWSQIRKNAADRKSDEQAVPTSTQRMSQTTEKTDDGETSGEETIEQRVARIRARVAQLTGNAKGDPTAQTTTEG